jgi:hypothetical protein
MRYAAWYEGAGAVFNTDPPLAGTTKPFVFTSCPPVSLQSFQALRKDAMDSE